MAKVNEIQTKLNNEISISFIGICEKDKEIQLFSELFKKIFSADLNLGNETTLNLSIKYDNDGVPIFKCKASIKEVNVHNDQLSLFDFVNNPKLDKHLNEFMNVVNEPGIDSMEIITSAGKTKISKRDIAQ